MRSDVTDATGNVACVIFCTKMWGAVPPAKFVVCPPCSAAYGPMPSHLDLTKETTLEFPNGVKGKIDDSQSKHSISVIFVNTGICQSGRTAHQPHADNNLRMTFHSTRCKVEE